MDEIRYDAYKRVRASLGAFPPGTIGATERELLEDCAEGLLLARAEDVEGREKLLDRASLTLAMLFGAQRITAAQSERIWAGMVACGPERPRTGSPRRSFSAA